MPPSVPDAMGPLTEPSISVSTTTANNGNEDVKRVAVIGSGLAGLTAAYLLAVNGYSVDLYEKGDKLGMAAASADLRLNEGNDKDEKANIIMDVPMRSFFPEHYTHLTPMYSHLNIPYHVSDNSISYTSYSTMAAPASSPASAGTNSESEGTYFSFSCYRIPFTASTVSLPDMPSWSAFQSSFSRSYASSKYAIRVVWGYIKFLFLIKFFAFMGLLGKRGAFERMPLKEFWRKYNIPKEFVEGAFEPLFCGVCTCSRDVLNTFPANTILGYAASAMPFGKMSFVSTGVKDVCLALTAPVQNIYLSTSVASVSHATPHAPQSRLHKSAVDASAGVQPAHLVLETSQGDKRSYHHVVFASQANQASAILKYSKGFREDYYAQLQTQALDRFTYEKSVVVCHTDETLMPHDQNRWRCLNFWRYSGKNMDDDDAAVSDNDKTDIPTEYNPKTTAACTHWFNASHPLLSHDRSTNKTPQPNYFQTTNPHRAPLSSKTISTHKFERAVVTSSSLLGLEQLDTLQGLRNRWFVGSYAWEGIPLLEGCVASAVEVVKSICEEEGLQAKVPWHKEKGLSWNVVFIVVAILMGLVAAYFAR
ncbi:hypothetical protein BC832DRAFT_208013 [Gaertneriomyces semiglobifer]|nr:hypothetical protein BC832DRAFT_208013 [Gaertneriomyces semiglobifer]